MPRLILLAFALLFSSSQAFADYQLQSTTTVTDGVGGTFTSTSSGTFDTLDNTTGSYTHTGQFSSFVLLATNPVITVNGGMTSVAVKTLDDMSITMNGSFSLGIGPITYPIVFDDLVVTRSEAGRSVSGTVTVMGFPIAIPPGHIAETIVLAVADLLGSK